MMRNSNKETEEMMNTDKINSLYRTLMAFDIEPPPFSIDWPLLAAQKLLDALIGKGDKGCSAHYSCPVRRQRQWIWKDSLILSPRGGKTCVECGTTIHEGDECVHVTVNHEQEGIRCLFCHQVSQDYCSPLGKLRLTVRSKTGMDYVTGEFVDEDE